jgi:hypothetical protein
MSQTVYRFKSAAHFRQGFDQAAAAVRLGELQERDGGLSIEAIIEEGLRPESPLHPQFSYSSEEALDVVWRTEAQYLRRTFVAVTLMSDGTEREIRAVVPIYDRDSEERRFITTSIALSDPEYREQVLDQALRDLIALRRKYADLQELARVFAAVDKVAASRLKQAA